MSSAPPPTTGPRLPVQRVRSGRPSARPALGRPGRTLTEPDELANTVHSLWGDAVALGLLAFALRFAVTSWLQPLAWRMPAWLGVLFMLVTTLLSVGVPLVLFASRVRRYRRLPRTLLLGRDRWRRSWRGPSSRLGGRPAARPATPVFAVPLSPWLGAYTIMIMAIVAGAPLPVLEAVLTVAVWFAFRGPHVALSADGVVVRRLWSGPHGQTVAWDDIQADRLPAPSPRARHAELTVRASGEGDAEGIGWANRLVPAVVGLGGRGNHGDQRIRLAVGWLWVHPEFLLCAIEHYAEHPDNRAAIGTRDELRRLTAALRSDPDRDDRAAAPVSERDTPSAAPAR